MTLDDLRALEAAATPGPWTQQTSWPGHVVPQAHARRPWGFAADPEVQERDYAQVIATVIKPETHSADAALIASMRNALPALLTIAEAARALADIDPTEGQWQPGACHWCQSFIGSGDGHNDGCLWLAATTALATLEDR